MNREKIVKEIKELEDKARELRKKLDSVDHEENLKKINVYKGKFFINNTSLREHDQYFRLIYVYDIDKETCTVKSIEITYYVGSEDWFNVDYYEQFNPVRYSDSEDDWVETKKEEFDKHFKEVQRRINKAYNI